MLQNYLRNVLPLLILLLAEATSSFANDLSPEEVEARVDLVRNCPLAEKLYDMLQVFGEDDLYTYVKPALTELQEINPTTDEYLEAFIGCFDKL